MKNLTMVVAMLGFVLLTGCNEPSNNPLQAPQDETTSLTKSGNDGPSASGQGSRTYEEGWRRVFAFHAATNSDGSVSGSGTYNRVSADPSLRLKFDFDIDCLVVDGNVAIMMGIITKSKYSGWVGRHFQFKVVDNGEGANAAPDQMTHFANWEPGVPNDTVPFIPNCGDDLGWELWNIEQGNIQVTQ